jgi:replication factor C subunit 2/4
MNNLPWTEKYRPNKIKDIISQENVVNSLSNKMDNLPHLILSGPPGTGKTSTALALGKELFGKLYKDRIIELNASDERGINTVRDKIKKFAKNAVHISEDSTPNYKIIILDEADSMTKDAQSALRKIIEDYSNITRFILICNYINKIIDPIISRCVIYNFIPVEKTIMFDTICKIADEEKIEYTEKIINKIIRISNGDMRKSIILLQNYKYMYEQNKEIDIVELNGYLRKNKILQIIDSIKTKSFNDNIKIVDSLIDSGYSIEFFLERFFKYLLQYDIDDKKKAKIIYRFSEIQKKLTEGSDEYIQLLDIILYTHIIMNNYEL